MSELTHQQQLDRGVKAKELLDSELLKQAFAAVEAALLQAIKVSKPEERETRERLYLALGTADGVQNVLRGWLADGQIVHANIEKLKKRNS